MKIGIAQRIADEAVRVNRKIDITPFKNKEAWAAYAIKSLRSAEDAAEAAGVHDRLHLWPDHEALGASAMIEAQSKVWKHPSGLSYDVRSLIFKSASHELRSYQHYP